MPKSPLRLKTPLERWVPVDDGEGADPDRDDPDQSEHGMQRSFVDHLDDVAATPSHDEHKRAALVMCGIIGWIGRGVVTALVGFFVVRAGGEMSPESVTGLNDEVRLN